MKTVLLANGAFPTHAQPLAALDYADVVVCCDGAIDTYRSRQKHAATRLFAVGDGDSRCDADPAFVLDSDQETNDLTKAFHFLLSHFAKTDIESIDILGATGLREDHTLGNISLLGLYARTLGDRGYMATTLRMLTDHGCFTPVAGRATLPSFPRQQVSLFSLTPDIPVSASGVAYPVERRRFDALWQGSLNAAVGDAVAIEGGLVLVYQTWEAKEDHHGTLKQRECVQ